MGVQYGEVLHRCVGISEQKAREICYTKVHMLCHIVPLPNVRLYTSQHETNCASGTVSGKKLSTVRPLVLSAYQIHGQQLPHHATFMVTTCTKPVVTNQHCNTGKYCTLVYELLLVVPTIDRFVINNSVSSKSNISALIQNIALLVC